MQLVKYDAMCRAITEAHKVDEVKDIRDKALAIETYSRQAKNMDAELKACEIRLRAERRAGQLLAEMEKAKAGRPPENPSPKGSNFRGGQTLRDMGISHKQSSNWQRLAKVPDEQFERAFATNSRQTTSGIIKASAPAKPKPQRSKEREAAMFVWGRLNDFEREEVMSVAPKFIIAELEEFQIDDIREKGPRVIKFLTKLVELCND